MMPFHPVKPIRGGKPLDSFYARLAEDPKYVCQAKLDGQRTIWDPSDSEPSGGTLWSRRGLRIFKAPEVVKALQSTRFRLDGELLLLDGRADYYVFDLPDSKAPLMERWEQIEDWYITLTPRSREVVHLCPSSVAWDEVNPSGWEGVVFKNKSSPYVRGSKPDDTTPHWIKYRAEWL